MGTQQQARLPHTSKKRLTRRFIIIASMIIAIILSIVWILSGLNIISSMWAIIISVPVTVFGVVFAFLALIPADHRSASPTAPVLSRPTTLDKPVYRGIVGLTPPFSPTTIQQREPIVRDVYAKLTQSNITALALTGIGGIGKSTLAALVFHYVVEQQRTGKGMFTVPPLWLRVDPSVTMVDILGNLSTALNVSMPEEVSTFSPQNLAAALFNMLNSAGVGRVIVFDQFENLVDNKGRARLDRPGIGELLDALNSQPCKSRILLTSRPDPQGTGDYPQTYLQIYHVEGLNEEDGIEILQKWNVNAADAEKRTAIQRCKGHALSLTLLASLLQKHNLSLNILLNDPRYTQLWTENIARKLLDTIFKEQLNSFERRLLLAFSIYREPVPLDAAQAIIDDSNIILMSQARSAIDALLTQHLLQAFGEGRYQPHAIVASYAQAHCIEDDEQANQQTLRTTHAKAAQYYQQQAGINCPPPKRRRPSDVHELIEAIQHLCLAGQWQGAYGLMKRTAIFSDLRLLGGNAILLELYQLLLPLEKWGPERLQQALIYNDLGRIYNSLEQWDEALKYHEQALSIFREIGQRRWEGVTLNELGSVYQVQSEKKRAQECYEKALSIFRGVEHNRQGEARALNNLSSIYADAGQRDEVQEYSNQAIDIYRKSRNRGGEGWALYNLGKVYANLGQVALALTYYEQVLRIRRELKNRGREAEILYDIGSIYFDQHLYDIALACFILALRIFEDMQNPNQNKTQKAIDSIQKEVGENRFPKLLTQVETQASKIVEKALKEGYR